MRQYEINGNRFLVSFRCTAFEVSYWTVQRARGEERSVMKPKGAPTQMHYPTGDPREVDYIEAVQCYRRDDHEEYLKWYAEKTIRWGAEVMPAVEPFVE